MEQFEYRKDARLGKEYTPSEWAGEPEYTKITRISMTSGGGMGGRHWYEYVRRLPEIPSNSIISATRYDGKEIKINTSFIVQAEDFTLAKASLDVTGWIEMGGNGDRFRDFYVLIDDGKELVLESDKKVLKKAIS